MFSAGGGSYRAAKILAASGPVRLVFVDTLYEDADAYRYLIEGAADILGAQVENVPQAADFPDYRCDDVDIATYAGNPAWRAFLADLRAWAAIQIPGLIWLVEGRDPWEVFRDGRFMGNARVDSCSRGLKRRVMDKWRRENCNRETDSFAVGIGDHEAHRFEGGKGKGGLRAHMAGSGWRYVAPLLGDPDYLPSLLYAPLEQIGPREPRLYGKGYRHNNCGGFCIKAGLAHWQNRFNVDRERFDYDAMMERKLREYVGTSKACFLRDRRGGTTKPLSLDDFGARLEAGNAPAYGYEPGASGCGCMTDT